MGVYYWIGNTETKEYMDFENAKHREIIGNGIDRALFTYFVDKYMGYNHYGRMTGNIVWLSDESGDWDYVTENGWKDITVDILLSLFDPHYSLWEVERYPHSLNFVFGKLRDADKKNKSHKKIDELLDGWIGQLKPYDKSKKAHNYIKNDKVKPLIKYLQNTFKDGFYIRTDKEIQRYIVKKLKASDIFKEEWNKAR